MTALLRYVLPLFLVAGCLSGDYNGDQGVSGSPDLSLRMFDIAGLDLFGAYNCGALNMCVRNCSTPACVQLCKNMATPIAKALENDLEGCFLQYCPAAGVCMPDAMGMLSVACNTCIANTFIPAGASCSATQNPDECHKCLPQANACTADM